VLNIIKQISNNKAPGQNKITSSMLKNSSFKIVLQVYLLTHTESPTLNLVGPAIFTRLYTVVKSLSAIAGVTSTGPMPIVRCLHCNLTRDAAVCRFTYNFCWV